VLVRQLAEQQAALAQVLHQRLVGRLEELPADQRQVLLERCRPAGPG
jgi:hypothetical protein